MKIGTLHRGIRLGSVCALLAAFAAAEDPPLPVSVSFKFRDASIREVPATEAMISEMLAKSLQERYKFWKFQTVSAASSHPQIQFWLRRNQEWDLHMNLTAQQGDQPKGEWKEKLFSPEDMTLLGDMLPREAGWKPEIKRAFESRLLETNKDKILKALRDHVRLGEKVEFDPPVPVAAPVPAILHLPKADFAGVAGHTFRIRYRSSLEEVWLHSRGTGIYEDARQGIRVMIHKWQSATGDAPVGDRLRDLSGLTPIHFYLGEPFDPSTSVAPGP